METEEKSCYDIPDRCLFPKDELPKHNDNMVLCEECSTWYHPRCENYLQAELHHFDKFICRECQKRNPSEKVTFNKSRNDCFRDSFADVHNRPEHLKGDEFKVITDSQGNEILVDGNNRPVVESGSERFIQLLTERVRNNPDKWKRAEENYRVKDAAAVTIKLFEEQGFKRPYYFPPETKPLGLEVPEKFSLDDQGNELQIKDVITQLHDTIGPGHELKYTDCQTQQEYPCSMDEWLEYYNNVDSNSKRYHKDEQKRTNRRYNVISLEYSKTYLNGNKRGNLGVLSPQLIRDINWSELWPETKDGKSTYDTSEERPSFMNYCLMGTKDSYTEWHIDLGGTSVWYHIHRGEKVFLLVEPTKDNIRLYREWEQLPDNKHWRTNYIEYCQENNHNCHPQILTLVQGSTVLIPSGWIHCVLTPKDSIVFGGNCLHSFNVDEQLEMDKLEKETQIPEKYRLNGFVKLHWYAAKKLRKDLKEANRARKEFPWCYVEALEKLYKFLKKNFAKKNLHDVPSEIAPASCLDKIRKELDTRKKWIKVGLWCDGDDSRTKLPVISNDEIGIEIDMRLPENMKPKSDRKTKPLKPRKSKKKTRYEMDEEREYEPPGDPFADQRQMLEQSDESISDCPSNDGDHQLSSPLPTKKVKKSPPKSTKRKKFLSNNERAEQLAKKFKDTKR